MSFSEKDRKRIQDIISGKQKATITVAKLPKITTKKPKETFVSKIFKLPKQEIKLAKQQFNFAKKEVGKIFSKDEWKSYFGGVKKASKAIAKVPARFDRSTRYAVGGQSLKDFIKNEKGGIDFKDSKGKNHQYLKAPVNTGSKTLNQLSDTVANIVGLFTHDPGMEIGMASNAVSDLSKVFKRSPKLPIKAVRETKLALPGGEKRLALPSRQLEKLKEKGFKLNTKQQGEGIIYQKGHVPKALPPTGTVAWDKNGNPILGLPGKPSRNPNSKFIDTPEVINMQGGKSINQVGVTADGKPIFGLPEGTMKTINKPITYNSGRAGKLTKAYIATINEAKKLGLTFEKDLPKIKQIFKMFAPKKGDYFQKAAEEYAQYQSRNKVKFNGNQLQSAINRGLEQNRWREVVGLPPLNKKYEQFINPDNYTSPQQAFINAKSRSGAISKFKANLTKKEKQALAQQELQRQAEQQQSNTFATNSRMKTDTVKFLNAKKGLKKGKKANAQQETPIAQSQAPVVQNNGKALNIDSAPAPDIVRVGDNKPSIKSQQEQAMLDYRKQQQAQGFGANPENSLEGQIVDYKPTEYNTNVSHVGKVLTALQDKYYPLNVLDAVGGKKLDYQNSVYIKGINAMRANGMGYRQITNGMMNNLGEVTGKPLSYFVEGLSDKEYLNLQRYLLNKHAMTRFDRGEKTFKNWTPEKGQAILDSLEKQYPHFKEMSKEWNTFNNQLNTNLVDGGILTPEAAQNYIKQNPDWASNQRLMENGSKPFKSAKSGFSGQKPTVNKGYSKQGSTKPIFNPIEMQMHRVYATANVIERNKVMQTLYQNILENPSVFENVAEIVPIEQNAKRELIDGINKALSEGGIENLDNHLNDLFYKTNVKKGKGNNIVRGLLDGQPFEIVVHDEAVLDALKGVNQSDFNKVLSALSMPVRIFKALTTTYNPKFVFGTSLPRDTIGGYIFSDIKNPVKYGADIMAATADILGNSAAYQDFLNQGAGMSGLVGSNVNLVAHTKHMITRKKGLKGLINKGARALDKVEHAITIGEQLPRLVEYKKVMSTLPENATKLQKEAKIAEAVYRANEITTNFAKSGKYSRYIEMVIPYFTATSNALVNAVDQTVRNPKVVFPKITAALTIPAIALYFINHEIKAYQQLDQNTKDNNFLIPLPNGKFYKIPLPKEQSYFFKVVPERLLASLKDRNPDAFYKLGDQFLNSFAPPGVSNAISGIANRFEGFKPLKETIAAPIGDVITNKNFYNGPIVPRRLENMNVQDQVLPSTTKFGKLAGKIGISPIKADYLLKSYSGATGQFGIPIMQGTSPLENFGTAFVANPKRNSDLLSRFYELKTKLYKDKNSKVENMDWGKYNFVNGVYNQISWKQNQKRNIQSDSSLSKSEKQKQLDKLQQEIIDLAQSAINYNR
jgi:hypothetical protein